MTTPETTQPPARHRTASRLRTGFLLLALLLASCAPLRSVSKATRDHKGGKRQLQRYYLPSPYIEVFAYEVRLLNRETLRVGFRPVSVADTTQSYFIEHNVGTFFEDRLRTIVSPEGLLEYVGYSRTPKQVETFAGAARIGLSFVAPLPGGLKGEDGIPEFSRLVYRRSFSVTHLLKTGEVPIEIGDREFKLFASLPFPVQGLPTNVAKLRVEQAGDDELKYRNEAINGDLGGHPPTKEATGFIHRPLMPLRIRITETSVEENGTQVGAIGVRMKTDANGAITILSTNNPPVALLQVKPTAREQGSATTRDAILHRNEAPITLNEIVYCANPWVSDVFLVPGAVLARQSCELRLAGGSLYDVRLSRDSEAYAFIGSLGDVAGGAIRIPANLFTFKVIHEGSSDANDAVGGGKAPRRYNNAEDKDKAPRRYLNAEDKD